MGSIFRDIEQELTRLWGNEGQAIAKTVLGQVPPCVLADWLLAVALSVSIDNLSLRKLGIQEQLGMKFNKQA